MNTMFNGNTSLCLYGTLCLWILAVKLVAQPLVNVQHFGLKDGLPGRIIQDVYADSKGFIWVCTNEGICRYDGHEFKPYQLLGQQANMQLLIGTFMEDAKKRVWVLGDKGAGFLNIYGYARVTPRLVVDKYASSDWQAFIRKFSPIVSKRILNVYSDRYHNTWLKLADGRLVWYDEQGLQPFLDFSWNIRDIAVNAKGTVWVADEKCLIEYTKAGDTLDITHMPFTIGAFFTDDKNRLWLIPEVTYRTNLYGFTLYVQKSNKEWSKVALDNIGKEPYVIKHHIEFLTWICPSGFIWIKDREKLFMLNDKGELIIDFSNHPSLANAKLSSLRKVLCSQPNVYWLITDKGLYKLIIKPSPFKVLLGGNDISSRGIWVDEQEEVLWANTYQGLKAVDIQNGDLLTSFNSSKYRTNIDLLMDAQERLWIGCSDNKLLYHNKLSKEVHYFPMKLDADEICAFYPSHTSDILWLGTSKGLYTYNGHEVKPYDKYNELDILKEATISKFYSNKAGLWVGSNKGLFLLDEHIGFVKKIEKLADIYILDIHEDSTGCFWLGTRGDGVIQWHPNGQIYQSYSMADGLSNPIIHAVHEDASGNLWLPSNFGLMCFNKHTKQVNTFYKEDGLADDEFNAFSHYRDSRGYLYVGGVNGITYFHPDSLPVFKSNDRPLYVTNFKSFDEYSSKYTDKTPSFLQKSKVSDPSFSLHVSLLDFSNTKKNKYAYRINGTENNWRYIDDNPLSIDNLPYGKHTLHVKGQGNYSQWASKELAIPIHIRRPLYLRWWFMPIYLIASLAIARAWYRWRIHRLEKSKEQLEKEVSKRTKKIKQQAEKLQQLDELKSRFFANVSHELRTPLTLIIGPLKKLLQAGSLPKETVDKLESIYRSSKQLQNLVEEILSITQIEAKNIKLEEKAVHFHPFIRHIFHAFESYSDFREIEAQLQYRLDEDLWLTLDTSKFEKVVNNLLSNAFKYTPRHGKVTLLVYQKDTDIYLEVQDNGQGIHPKDLPNIFDRFYQAEHTPQVQGGLGIGLALAKELVQLLEGQLYVTSQLGQGSIFTLSFPVKLQSPTENQDTKTYSYSPPKVSKSTSTPFIKDKKDVIIIVEDSAEMQAFLVQILAPAYQIITANDGANAIDILKTYGQYINLIISDLMMPENNGFMLLEAVKAHPEWHSIPFIMLTARAEQATKFKALEKGVDDYLIKPFDPDELLAYARNALYHAAQRKKWLDLPNIKAPVFKTEASVDTKWLKQLEKATITHIDQKDFTVVKLASEMALEKRQLARKLKSLTGMTPGNYLREIRLQKARHLLETKAFSTVAEASYAVGFSTPSYFSALYKERFGKHPSDYIAQ